MIYVYYRRPCAMKTQLMAINISLLEGILCLSLCHCGLGELADVSNYIWISDLDQSCSTLVPGRDGISQRKVWRLQILDRRQRPDLRGNLALE